MLCCLEIIFLFAVLSCFILAFAGSLILLFTFHNFPLESIMCRKNCYIQKTAEILAVLIANFWYYLTPILVAFAFPDKISLIEYLAEAIITFVPILTAFLTYSSLALAPLAPTLDAPLQ